MKRLLLCATVLSLVAIARADDQTQAVQQALKDQGFYYGEVDGQSGPQTDAAVRRYQIRQGLDVTGKIDEPTLDSLHLGSGSDNNTLHAVPPPSNDSADSQQPAPQDTPAPKSLVQSDHDFLKKHPTATPAPAPDDDSAPQPPDQSQPPRAQPIPDQDGAGQSLPRDYSGFFRRTPYESAPPEVQRSTVQRAQARLAREGFYRGVADGELGDALSRAIVAYQRDAEIPPSGRLDMETLSDLQLLPKRHILAPPLPYGYPVQPYGGRDVYRGIWVH